MSDAPSHMSASATIYRRWRVAGLTHAEALEQAAQFAMRHEADNENYSAGDLDAQLAAIGAAMARP